MQEGWSSYITDFVDLMQKIANLKTIPNDVILVSSDIVGLYLSTPDDCEVEVIEEALGERERKHVFITIFQNKFKRL